jgi:hypothetical protein
MSNALRPQIFALRTTQPWGLPPLEERDVKERIRGAVRAYARRIQMAFGDGREIFWVVM